MLEHRTVTANNEDQAVEKVKEYYSDRSRFLMERPILVDTPATYANGKSSYTFSVKINTRLDKNGDLLDVGSLVYYSQWVTNGSKDGRTASEHDIRKGIVTGYLKYTGRFSIENIDGFGDGPVNRKHYTLITA